MGGGRVLRAMVQGDYLTKAWAYDLVDDEDFGVQSVVGEWRAKILSCDDGPSAGSFQNMYFVADTPEIALEPAGSGGYRSVRIVSSGVSLVAGGEKPDPDISRFAAQFSARYISLIQRYQAYRSFDNVYRAFLMFKLALFEARRAGNHASLEPFEFWLSDDYVIEPVVVPKHLDGLRTERVRRLCVKNYREILTTLDLWGGVFVAYPENPSKLYDGHVGFGLGTKFFSSNLQFQQRMQSVANFWRQMTLRPRRF